MIEPEVHLAAALLEVAGRYEGPVPSYSRAHGAAVSGRFPVKRRGGRLMVRREDYPRIAEHFGLTPRDTQSEPAESKRRRRAA